MSALEKTYHHAPPALAYMLQAFRPSPGWSSKRGCPDLEMKWRGCRIEPAAVERLRSICGIDADLSSSRIGILYPQVTGFRLIMAMLTHPAWPLPIWNALQIRNRMLLHAPLRPGEEFELAAGASAWRVLAKGVEIDLHLRLARDGDVRWESVVTFYYRGRYGDELQQGTALGAPAASPTLALPDESNGGDVVPGGTGGSEGQRSDTEIISWNVGNGDRWRFGSLTGDYNGLHQWNWYARRLGFPAAFPHPQRVLGQCLARMPEPGPAPVRLDLWIKGPVFFGRDVIFRHSPGNAPGIHEFGLWLRGEPRPSLIGSLGNVGLVDSRLAA